MITVLALWLEDRSHKNYWPNVYVGTVTIDIVGILVTYEIAKLLIA